MHNYQQEERLLIRTRTRGVGSETKASFPKANSYTVIAKTFSSKLDKSNRYTTLEELKNWVSFPN